MCPKFISSELRARVDGFGADPPGCGGLVPAMTLVLSLTLVTGRGGSDEYALSVSCVAADGAERRRLYLARYLYLDGVAALEDGRALAGYWRVPFRRGDGPGVWREVDGV